MKSRCGSRHDLEDTLGNKNSQSFSHASVSTAAAATAAGVLNLFLLEKH